MYNEGEKGFGERRISHKIIKILGNPELEQVVDPSSRGTPATHIPVLDSGLLAKKRRENYRRRMGIWTRCFHSSLSTSGGGESMKRLVRSFISVCPVVYWRYISMNVLIRIGSGAVGR